MNFVLVVAEPLDIRHFLGAKTFTVNIRQPGLPNVQSPGAVYAEDLFTIRAKGHPLNGRFMTAIGADACRGF